MTAAAELPYGPPTHTSPARTPAARSGAARAGSAARVASAARARTGVVPVTRRRPTLRLVAGVRAETARAPFIAVVVALLVAGLLGLLVLNTVLAQDSFTLFALNKDTRVLVDREQSLSREVEARRAPEALAAKAAALGMVQTGSPAFLRLQDGAILGSASPAPAADAPAPDAPAPAPVDVAQGDR